MSVVQCDMVLFIFKIPIVFIFSICLRFFVLVRKCMVAG